jgi:ATP-dependent DNA helicase RecQ
VLALTTTATPAVAEDICREFRIGAGARVHTGFHRPNLTLHATACTPDAKTQKLLDRLRRTTGAGIVYVTLQKTAERVAAALAGAGLHARAYHAGMDAGARATVQDWFMAEPDAIVVATIAFGMGIDKAGIRRVIHYNLPKSRENYSQEIGRAGRDGQPSVCDVLVTPSDTTALENFTYGNTPGEKSARTLVDEMLSRDAPAATASVPAHALGGLRRGAPSPGESPVSLNPTGETPVPPDPHRLTLTSVNSGAFLCTSAPPHLCLSA